MSTRHLSSKRLSLYGVKLLRGILKNNKDLQKGYTVVVTTDKWIPYILVDMGFFPSTSCVKQNRPDLWRNIALEDNFDYNWHHTEEINIGQIQLTIIYIPENCKWIDIKEKENAIEYGV
jgi:hypothetical protein